MSINKIHINSTTKMSLNDRFTVMQSVGPKMPSPVRKVPRRRTRSASLDRGRSRPTLANRKFLEQLDKKHKMRAALKLKRKSMKVTLPSRQRIRNRIGLKKGAANAIRLTTGGRLSRSNSLTNIATMKADLMQPALRRSNSTSSLAGRLGARRGSTGSAQTPRRRLKRNNIVRSNSRSDLSRTNSQQNLTRSNSRSRSNLARTNSQQNLTRSNSRSRSNLSRTNSQQNLTRSNSRSNLRRPNSRFNLTRSNSKSDLNRAQQPRRRFRPAATAPNGRAPGRAPGRRNSSIVSRLGIKRTPIMARDRIRVARNTRNPARVQVGGAAGRVQARILKRRNSNISVSNRIRGGARQERVGRQRGRGNNAQRGRSRSRSRGVTRNTPGPRQNNNAPRGNRNGSRGRGRAPRGKGPRTNINRADLDKELDQYMSTTKSGNEMDTL